MLTLSSGIASYLRAKPDFLLLVTEYSNKSEPDLRLYSKATKEIKRVDLEISSAEVSDSALYYCALEHSHRKHSTHHTKNLIQSWIYSILHIHYSDYMKDATLSL